MPATRKGLDRSGGHYPERDQQKEHVEEETVSESLLRTSSMNSTNGFTDQTDKGNVTVSPRTTEVSLQLAWIIPTCIGLVFFLFLLALLLYYTIRWVELFVLHTCNKYFGCCNPRGRRREEYKNLQDEESDAKFSLQELKARSDKDDKENK